MERQIIKRGLNRIIILPIVLTVLFTAGLLWQLNRMLDQAAWVEHSSSVISTSSMVEKQILAQSNSLRGYLLRQTPAFAEHFRQQDHIVDSSFQALHHLVIDNKTQIHRLDTLLQSYWQWQSLARHSLIPTSIDYTDVDLRSDMLQTIGAMFRRFNQDEEDLLAERRRDFATGTRFFVISIATLTIGIGLIIGFNARRQANRFVQRFTSAVDEATRSTELLQTTLLSIGDAIIVTDRNRRVTLMNGRAEELTGWSQDEARGRTLDEVFVIVDEITRQHLPNPVTTAIRESRTVELTNHSLLLSRRGIEYPVDDSASPIRNARRETIGAILVFRDITARKENEMEAQEREREFRALIENAPDVIIRYDQELRIIYVNPAIEHMLGISPQALIGKRFKDVGIPEGVYGPWEKAVQDVFLIQRSISTEIQYQTLHGFRRYQARLVPEKDDDQVQSVISISRDITEIKQIEDRLRESEQRFRGVVENSPDAFYLLRAVRNSKREIIDFTFEYINTVGAQLITVRTEDCIGRRMTEVMSGPRVEAFVAKYASVIESGVPTIDRYRVESPYLRIAQWLRSQYIPIGDNLAITTVDITDRKQTEDALRASEERYRRLVDNASEAIFSTDNEGRFTYANPYIRELSGYSTEDVPKFFFTDLVAPSYKTRVQRHFYRQFLSRTPNSFVEAPFVTKSGDERWLAVTTSLRIRDGVVEGFDCIATDITERVHKEQQLLQAMDKAQAAARSTTNRVTHTTESLQVTLRDILRVSNQLKDGKLPDDLIQTASRIAGDASRALETLDEMSRIRPSNGADAA